jgi:hypothetical protein
VGFINRTFKNIRVAFATAALGAAVGITSTTAAICLSMVFGIADYGLDTVNQVS